MPSRNTNYRLIALRFDQIEMYYYENIDLIGDQIISQSLRGGDRLLDLDRRPQCRSIFKNIYVTLR